MTHRSCRGGYGTRQGSLSGSSGSPCDTMYCSYIMTRADTQELPGRLWNGKEAVLEALAALSKATPAETGTTPVVESLVAATARKNTAFRKAALAALDAAVTALPGDHFPAAGLPLLDALEQHGAAPASTSSTTSVRSASRSLHDRASNVFCPSFFECVRVRVPLTPGLPVPVEGREGWMEAGRRNRSGTDSNKRRCTPVPSLCWPMLPMGTASENEGVRNDAEGVVERERQKMGCRPG
jgi:hypothetical protein